MPQITSIKKSRKKDIYIVTIDSTNYEITEDTIVHFALVKEKELTDNELKEIILETDKDKLFAKTCNYISYQLRSESEIYKYLRILTTNEKVVGEIVNKLKTLKLIDDDLLSKSILDSCIYNLKGIKYYRNKLFERKINFEHSYLCEEEVLQKSIEKNKNKDTKNPINKQKNALISKLLRDGFSENLVFKNINEVEFSYEENDKIFKDIDKIKRKYHDLDDRSLKNKLIQSLLLKGYEYKEIIECINIEN